ncbi:MAG: SPOR domain-containing protein [Treponema sp.]|jgi:DedD protein|nr:SPOR domain-containing protein [Treponema sp.]
MEKKKLLLVTISVGVFLVVVIGASLMIFSPRNPVPAVTAAAMPERTVPVGVPGTLDPAVAPGGVSAITITPDIEVTPGIAGSPVPGAEGSSPETDRSLSQEQPATADPAELVRNSGNYQALQVPPSSASAIQENRFYINSDTGQPALIERQEEKKDTRVVINVPRPQTAAVPNSSPPSRSAPAPASRSSPAPASRTERVNRPADKPGASGAAKLPSALTVAVASPARTAAAAASRKTTAPAARVVPQQQSRGGYDAYWVQTGSFPTKNQAEKAKEILAGKGLTAVIENGDVKGETWYRVRIGPYTSQNEANYWLSLVKSINGNPYVDLASSIVWKSYTRP